MSKNDERGGAKSVNKPKTDNVPRKEIKYHESPMERALKLSSEQMLALAIRDIIKRDGLN